MTNISDKLPIDWPIISDTITCSVNTEVTVISSGDVEHLVSMIITSETTNLHCTDKSNNVHAKERACRIRIEQTKESACKFDQFLFGPEINKVTCIHEILVLYGVLTTYVFHQVRPPDQGVYSWTTMKIEELLFLKETGWGPPTDSTRSRINQTSRRCFCFLRLD